jgi:RsiW-degrading membrane proteinase PrsW (M82 family)
MDNSLAIVSISTIATALPIAIWLYIFFANKRQNRKVLLLMFLLGCLTAPALLGVQYLWNAYPEFNIENFLSNSIHTENTRYIAIFVLFGGLEEIIKMFVVRAVDKKTLFIKKVNDAIYYSILSALGFSFVENIYYMYQYWEFLSVNELAGMHFFRSIFTTCAHIIFSGIFGYYYGIGKYSIHLKEHSNLLGNKSRLDRIISRLFNISLSESFRERIILKGLFIAIFMHSLFNYFLHLQAALLKTTVMISVAVGYFYLEFLLSRKAGHLVLTTDISNATRSTIAKKDKDVVIDLLALWFKEKKYVDVIHVCERLLERDPDNKIVALFKAKALDETEDNSVYKSILNTVIKSKSELSNKDINIISKHTKEKEELAKVKEKIKRMIEKEKSAIIGRDESQKS